MAATRNSPPAKVGDVLDVLRAQLAQDIAADQTICVAFSGGMDSTVLLDALTQLLPPHRLSACHIHHGLSLHADEWAGFCQRFANDRGISIHIERVQVSKIAGDGLESAARTARYGVFAKMSADVVAFAHHLQDQSETVLFKLLRGAGVSGMAGMPAKRLLASGERQMLWRPLLGVSRDVLKAYALTRGLRWIEDDSNTNLAFARNYLRHAVLPAIRQRFPAADQLFGRAAEQAAEAAALLDERAAEDLAILKVAERLDRLDLVRFQTLSPPRQRNVLRYWIKLAGWFAPERRTLLAWQSQLQSADMATQLILSYPAGECRVWQGSLYRLPRLEMPLPDVMWQGEPELPWAGGVIHFRQISIAFSEVSDKESVKMLISEQRLAKAQLAGLPIVLRGRLGGERLKLAANRPRRPLKKIMQEIEAPPWVRDRLPMLWVGSELVACVNVGVAIDWQPECTEVLEMALEVSFVDTQT